MRLGEALDPFNPGVQAFLDRTREFLLQHGGDPAGAQRRALQVLADLHHQQAASLAYFDVFWLSSVVAVVLVLAVLLMKRSVAEKASHIAAE